MVDEIIYRQLVLLKAFYQHGIYHSKIQSPLDNMLAIHHFDMCNEFVLRIISESIKIKKETKVITLGALYEQIYTQLKEKKRIELNYKKQIITVRQIRNDVQHNAETKTQESVNRCSTYTFDFLNDTIKKVFNIDFDDINLVELISETKIKNRMIKALKLIKEEKYKDALGLIINCFGEKIYNFKEKIDLHSETALFSSTVAYDFHKMIEIPFSHISSAIEINNLPNIRDVDLNMGKLIKAIQKNNEYIKSINEDISKTINNKLEEVTNSLIKDYMIIALNINLLKYSEYKKTIDWMISDEVLGKKDVEDCFDFVIEVILKIESKNEY